MDPLRATSLEVEAHQLCCFVGTKWLAERFQKDRAARLAEGAEDAFRTLEPRASPAIPQLARLAKDRSRGWSSHRAASVLNSIGSETQGIVLDLLNDPRP